MVQWTSTHVELAQTARIHILKDQHMLAPVNACMYLAKAWISQRCINQPPYEDEVDAFQQHQNNSPDAVCHPHNVPPPQNVTMPHLVVNRNTV